MVASPHSKSRASQIYDYDLDAVARDKTIKRIDDKLDRIVGRDPSFKPTADILSATLTLGPENIAFELDQGFLDGCQHMLSSNPPRDGRGNLTYSEFLLVIDRLLSHRYKNNYQREEYYLIIQSILEKTRGTFNTFAETYDNNLSHHNALLNRASDFLDRNETNKIYNSDNNPTIFSNISGPVQELHKINP